ncbi:hypothetical protein NE619_14910 [Anaerovorax odorimutans]|uniref:Uncharacterized protein n=1 Tax=Anaerovorax odorimutans TaxID=109327 RepID=A0ABT1RS50_9FIRM|nr:hypothetical protein [Anaerovorax odorimutans]
MSTEGTSLPAPGNSLHATNPARADEKLIAGNGNSFFKSTAVPQSCGFEGTKTTALPSLSAGKKPVLKILTDRGAHHDNRKKSH